MTEPVPCGDPIPDSDVRYEARLAHPSDFEGWRTAARSALALRLPPEAIVWRVAGEAGDLLGAGASLPPAPDGVRLRVPPAFVEAAREAVQHRDGERFALLYALLARIEAGERRLMEVSSDPQIHRLHTLRKAVRRDQHKMKAFVRFRGRAADTSGAMGADEGASDIARAVAEAEGVVGNAPTSGEGPDYVAWFEPEHHTLRDTALFFVRRFTQMRWAILTPELSAFWDGETLTFGAGATRDDAPPDDAMEDAWRAYYTAIFNPARLKIDAMTSEMPKKYWHNLPEARLIRPLIQEAGRRTDEMIARGREAGLVGFETYRPSSAEPRRGVEAEIGGRTQPAASVPERTESSGVDGTQYGSSIAEARGMDRRQTQGGRSQDDLFGSDADKPVDTDAIAEEAGAGEVQSLGTLEAAAKACTLCPLYAPATQTVFGEGPPDAPLMFIGEQPGDKEDIAGRPFVGPAGRVFDRALSDAGIDRDRVYVTNAVKHFKFVPRGPRRIHQKPGITEIKACNIWLQGEIAAVRPAMVVALGATAGRAIFGREIGVMKSRGTVFDMDEDLQAYVTVHPSFLLRLPDEEQKRMEYNRFLADLRRIADAVPQARMGA